MQLSNRILTITGSLMGFIVVLLGIHLSQTNTSDVILHDEATTSEGNQIVITTNPQVVEAQKPFALTLDILSEDGKTLITDFEEVHTKLLHLILVTEDLKSFLHLHPDYDGNGRFTLKDVVLPEASNYVVFADFTPKDGHQQAVRAVLSTKDSQSAEAQLAVSESEVVVGPLRVELQQPESLAAGHEESLTFHITNAETGEPVDRLDEYLGAAGHLVMIDQTTQIYVHTHPADHDMDSMSGMSMAMHYGPDIQFETEFPATGFYALWLQVQYKGEVLTAPFVVEVNQVVEADPDATPEVHGHS